jgi:prepilin-type N-terminal cleavage/methylation domain-containing protein
MTRRRTRRPGFTLIEILLVMAMLLVLSALAYPTLSAMYGDVRVKAAADDVRAAWADARSHAIEDGRAYRFAVQPGTGKYRVAPDADGFWDGSGGADAGDGEAPAFTNEGSLPNGIQFDVGGDLPSTGEWTTVVVFNPDGGCNADTEVTLKEDDEDGTPIVVRVRAMTGAVTVRKKSAGDR